MITLKTPPLAEPLTLAEVKDFLRITNDVEDVFLSSLIKSAREYVETNTSNLLGKQEWVYKAKANSRSLTIPFVPVISIESVKSDDKEIPYRIVYGTEPMRIEVDYDNVEVDFWAGWEEIPSSLKLSMLQLISFWYENRTTETPVRSEILDNFRVWRL